MSDDICANCGEDDYKCGCNERERFKAENRQLRKRVAELEARNADLSDRLTKCMQEMVRIWENGLAHDEAKFLEDRLNIARDTAWNDAIRAAVNELRNRERFTSAGVIWPMLRNEGDSNE